MKLWETNHTIKGDMFYVRPICVPCITMYMYVKLICSCAMDMLVCYGCVKSICRYVMDKTKSK